MTRGSMMWGQGMAARTGRNWEQNCKERKCQERGTRRGKDENREKCTFYSSNSELFTPKSYH